MHPSSPGPPEMALLAETVPIYGMTACYADQVPEKEERTDISSVSHITMNMRHNNRMRIIHATHLRVVSHEYLSLSCRTNNCDAQILPLVMCQFKAGLLEVFDDK